MPRFMWFLAFALLASVTGPRANAALKVSIAPTLPFSGYSTRINTCDGFAEDELTLTISDRGKQIVSKGFCSSYGRASARAVINKFGEKFIVLNFSEGRGSNAWTDYLGLYRLPDLLEVLRIPLSWGTSGTGRFTYNYVVELPASGGISFRLNGQDRQAPNPGPICCVPEAHNLTIYIP